MAHTEDELIEGEPDYFVHFGNGIMETYAKMAAMKAEGEAAAAE